MSGYFGKAAFIQWVGILIIINMIIPYRGPINRSSWNSTLVFSIFVSSLYVFYIPRSVEKIFAIEVEKIFVDDCLDLKKILKLLHCLIWSSQILCDVGIIPVLMGSLVFKELTQDCIAESGVRSSPVTWVLIWNWLIVNSLWIYPVELKCKTPW